jgi:hypothetical protein
MKPQQLAAEVHKPETLRQQDAHGAHANEQGAFPPHAYHREDECGITEPQKIRRPICLPINRNQHGEENGAGRFGDQWNFAVGSLQTAWRIANMNLPHDDFRRAQHDHRGAHDDWRRSDYYAFRMTFISRVPMPSAFRNNTSGSREEGDDAG